MPHIDLKYGATTLACDFDPERFDVLAADTPAALSDAELGTKFDEPIGSLTLEEIVGTGGTVLIVVPDATREVGSAQIVNLLVRRLIAAGIEASYISIIFATGIHRAVTEDEKAAIISPFIAQRIKTLEHSARDLARMVRVGETSGGIPVELNRALLEHDHVILVGGVSFHYFAGFTGSRKLVCPGLASSRTISATHRLAFDCEKLGRRDGVGTGILDGNAVHEAFIECAAFAKPAFAVNSVVDNNGDIVDLFCGDWLLSHRAACDAYSAKNTIAVGEKRELVVVSCGGHPHDVNMIQAHKALDGAAQICRDGGTIILLAECAEGLGRADFADWFDAFDSRELAVKLCEKYQVNGQTAWSLLRKAERFNIEIVTSLDVEIAAKMRMKKVSGIPDLANTVGGYIISDGARVRAAVR